MSLFFNYDKPGRGISREEAEKRNYFDILMRKFTLIIRANLLFFGVNIVLFAALFLFFLPFFVHTSEEAVNDLVSHLSEIFSGKQLMSPIPFVILALFSPTFAGLTYLCRNFSKQEHVFLASDFFEHTKKNFKQSILAGLIMSAALYLYMTAFIYYWHSGMIVLLAVISIMGILLSFTSFYVFPIMVTFKLSLAEIFKNAFLFSFINLPQNMLVFVLLSAIHILLIYNAPLIYVLLTVFFLIAFSTYTINFIVWNAISKYMQK